MAKKIKFDYKQFLLEKGERFGLVVAVVLTVLLIVLGVMTGLKKSSPLPQLQTNTKDLDNRVLNAPVPVDKNPLTTPPRFLADLDPGPTATYEWMPRKNWEDNKRHNPRILSLVRDKETGRPVTQVDVLRAPVRVLDYLPGDRLNTLSAERSKPDVKHPGEKLRPVHMVIVSAAFPYQDQVKEFENALALKRGRKLKTPPQFLGFYVSRRVTGPDGTVKQDPELKLEAEDSELRKLLSVSAELAPWNKNLRQFAYPGMVMPLPALTKDKAYPALKLGDLLPQTENPKKDDEDRKEEATDRGGKTNLVIAPLKLKGDDDDDAFPEELKNRLAGKTIKVFDPDAGGGFSGGDKKTSGEKAILGDPRNMKPGDQPKKKKSKKKEKTYTNCLFRFVDVDVKPGHTYEYLIVIRVTNPNYNKPDEVADEREAQDKELLSAPHYIPPVQIPFDSAYYAVDEKELQGRDFDTTRDTIAMVGFERTQAGNKPKFNEQVAVQMHRWVDTVRDGRLQVGDWLIAERLLFSRGDYLLRKAVPLQVPHWVEREEQFRVKGPYPKSKKKPKRGDYPEVEFSTKTTGALPSAILVDYYGGRIEGKAGGVRGKQLTVPDESAAELLVVNSDGKLDVRDGRADGDPDTSAGAERLERYQAWKSRIKDLSQIGEKKKDPKKKGSRFDD